jgi:hypothetical protein
MSAAPQNAPQENDLLVKFEIDNIPAEYREYYTIKRNKFFASIQSFREMWDCYMRLDAIWMREFADLKTARNPERMFHGRSFRAGDIRRSDRIQGELYRVEPRTGALSYSRCYSRVPRWSEHCSMTMTSVSSSMTDSGGCATMSSDTRSS